MMPGGMDRDRLMSESLTPVTPEQARKAALSVAAMADGDRVAAREVLDMLGLTEVLS